MSNTPVDKTLEGMNPEIQSVLKKKSKKAEQSKVQSDLEIIYFEVISGVTLEELLPLLAEKKIYIDDMKKEETEEEYKLRVESELQTWVDLVNSFGQKNLNYDELGQRVSRERPNMKYGTEDLLEKCAFNRKSCIKHILESEKTGQIATKVFYTIGEKEYKAKMEVYREKNKKIADRIKAKLDCFKSVFPDKWEEIIQKGESILRFRSLRSAKKSERPDPDFLESIIEDKNLRELNKQFMEGVNSDAQYMELYKRITRE